MIEWCYGFSVHWNHLYSCMFQTILCGYNRWTGWKQPNEQVQPFFSAKTMIESVHYETKRLSPSWFDHWYSHSRLRRSSNEFVAGIGTVWTRELFRTSGKQSHRAIIRSRLRSKQGRHPKRPSSIQPKPWTDENPWFANVVRNFETSRKDPREQVYLSIGRKGKRCLRGTSLKRSREAFWCLTCYC